MSTSAGAEVHTCSVCGTSDARGERTRPGDPTSDWWCIACVVVLCERIIDLLRNAPADWQWSA